MALHVVTGATRSGKSAHAERLVGRLAAASDGAVAYLATGPADDPAFAARIAAHRARRPADWTTATVEDDLAAAVREAGDAVVLLDGLGGWVAGVLHRAGAFDDAAGLERAAARVEAEVGALLDAAATRTAATIVVCEQAGAAPVAPDAATRRWVDLLGTATQRLADAAASVELVVAGRALALPPTAVDLGSPGDPNSTAAPAPKPDHGDRMVPPGHVDLAVNVVPGGPPAWLRGALRRALEEDAGRYPDERPTRAAVAARLGRPADEVLLLNGAAEGFWLLAGALAPVAAAISTPSFSEPTTALRAHGVEPVRVPRVEADGFALRPESVPADAELVLVGNPCNPTGALHPAEALLRLARPGRVLVVDESFLDLVPGEPGALVGRRGVPGLVVLRSLTKALGLPGIRAGLLTGPTDLVGRLEARRQAWPLNALALAALEAWAARDDPTGELAARVAADRDHLVHALAALPGVAVAPAAANFVCVRVPDGPRALAALRADRLAVRPTADLGLGPEHLRIAVRDPATSDRVVAALAAAL